jgi:hypothetical protein
MDDFFDVARTTVTTTEGPVDLPILYREATAAMVFVLARESAVNGLLAGTGLRAAGGAFGRVPIGIARYEYRSTTVGVYNEVGLALLAVREGERSPPLGVFDLLVSPRHRRLGAWVADLPVTTAAADAAGREIWGYPKFVTEIPFSIHDGRLTCSVLDPDRQDRAIVQVDGSLGPSIPGPPIDLVTWSRLEGTLIRTEVTVRGAMRIHLAGDVRVRVGPSKHRMAEHLRALGLAEDPQGARAIAVAATERFQSRLPAGVRV